MSLVEAVELEEELARRRSRNGLLSFSLQTIPEFEVNWHHRRICQAINALRQGHTHRQLLATFGIEGDELERQLKTAHPVTGLYAGLTSPHAIDSVIRNLQIALPPRHGKSTLASISMPAWWFGTDPDAQMISVSYSADLASRLNRQVQQVMDSPNYLGIFPATRLSGKNIRTVAGGNWLRNSDLFEIVERKGVFRAAGVAGGITGMGASVAIIDDPIKNREQADSAVVREAVWNWYGSTLYTRKHKDAVQVSIATSWHEDDLNNRLRNRAMADPESDQWFCLIYPAILDCEPTPGDPREQGEAMWPDHFPIEQLRATRATIGTYEFEALYQQRPAPREGGIVKVSWLKYYHVLPQGLTNYTISADLIFGEETGTRGDFVCIQVWACLSADRYLVDQVHARLEFTEQLRAMRSLAQKYRLARKKLLEDAANARAMKSVLQREIAGLLLVRAEGSKSARLAACSPQIESGNVYLPSPEIAPWVQKNVHELASFPNAAHDDTVDAMSLALNYLDAGRSYVKGAMPGGSTRTSRWHSGAAAR